MAAIQGATIPPVKPCKVTIGCELFRFNNDGGHGWEVIIFARDEGQLDGMKYCLEIVLTVLPYRISRFLSREEDLYSSLKSQLH